MREPGSIALGTWSGGRFLHFGEAVEEDRLAAVLRPGEGIDTVLSADAYGQGEADRLLGRDNYRWSVLGAGRAQMPIAAQAAAMGGNVRVGLEDSLWIGPGQLAQSNAQQVTKVRKILEGLGLEIATPDEAREILSLKGGDKVGF